MGTQYGTELHRTAIEEIRRGRLQAAREALRRASSVDLENPETYNLLGISYEMEGDRLKAARFYRVAYYMDQDFSAPADNLDRVCNFWYKGTSDINWGI